MELIQTIVAVIIGLLFIGLFFYLLFEDLISYVIWFFGWRKFFKNHPTYKDNWKEHFKYFRKNNNYYGSIE